MEMPSEEFLKNRAEEHPSLIEDYHKAMTSPSEDVNATLDKLHTPEFKTEDVLDALAEHEPNLPTYVKMMLQFASWDMRTLDGNLESLSEEFDEMVTRHNELVDRLNNYEKYTDGKWVAVSQEERG